MTELLNRHSSSTDAMKKRKAIQRANNLRLRLSASWTARPRNLGDFIDERIAFLAALQSVHPLFKNGLHFIGDSLKNSPLLAPNLSNLAALMIDQSWDRATPNAYFDRVRPQGQATRETTSWIGFALTVSNLRSPDKDQVLIDLLGGSMNPDQSDGVDIYLPFDAGPEFADPFFLHALLGFVVDYWLPERAVITNRALDDITRERPPYTAPVGWLTYLNEAQVAEVLPPSILCMRLDPGVTFTLLPTPPTKGGEAFVEVARKVRDALMPGEWLTERHWRGKKRALAANVSRTSLMPHIGKANDKAAQL